MTTTGTSAASSVAHSSTRCQRGPGAQRGRGGGVDDRPVGQRVRERDPELDEVRAGLGVGVARSRRAVD